MKKIFTLLFAVGSITIASAQSTARHESKTDSKPGVTVSDYGKEKDNFSAREKDAMIRKINAEYDRKVAEVKSNRRLKSREKSRQIQMLNKQRAEEIRQVQLRFEKSNHGRDNRPYDDHKGHRS